MKEQEIPSSESSTTSSTPGYTMNPENHSSNRGSNDGRRRKRKPGGSGSNPHRGASGQEGNPSGNNDAQDYLHDALLAAMAGDVNYVYPAGAVVPLRVFNSPIGSQLYDATYLNSDGSVTTVSNGGYSSWNRVLPSLMTLRLYPAYGLSKDASSALNVAAEAIRTFQRSTSSGRINYDAPDLYLFICGTADLFSYIEFLKRIAYGIDTFNQLDWSLPELFLKANYCDPTDFLVHRRTLWSGIEELIVLSAKLSVPDKSVMPIFNRRMFIYSGIYREGDSSKDQLYMYTPAAFYKWGLDDKGAGQLTLAGQDMFLPGKSNTVEQFIQFGRDLVAALVNDSMHSTMAGDLLKAYGSATLKAQPLQLNFTLAPAFNIEVLEQMMNATAVGEVAGGTVNQTNLDAPNAGQPYLTSVYYAAEGSDVGVANDDSMTFRATRFLENDILLSTTTNKVGPVLTLVNTRLTAMIDPAVTQTFLSKSGTPPKVMTLSAIMCGTEICEAFYTWQRNATGTFTFQRLIQENVIPITPNAGVSYTSLKAIYAQIQALSAFKFHPKVQLVTETTSAAENSAYNVMGEIFDYDNFAPLDYQQLFQMHRTCIMSLLGLKP